MTEIERSEIQQQFHSIFGTGGRVRLIRSPGRVNLIGEHTDYNEGFVFPMAIEPEIRFACRARTDGQVRLASSLYPDQIIEFSIHRKIEPGQPAWSNYVRGVAAELIGAGIALEGMDLFVANTLPMGGGLSSSAALEVGTALCFLTQQGQKMDLSRLALLCQKAEHEYACVPCGIMDQTIVSAAQAGHAMLLDCRNGIKQFIRMDEKDLRVVIVNTMVRHELSGGEYASRRKQCEEGAAFFHQQNPAIRSLRDVTTKQLDEAKGQLAPATFKRCRHVVSENRRTADAALALERKHYDRAGELMIQSHQSLRDDFEVSCPELDFLADQAVTIKGVYGARMTGGGFGGCIVALVQPRAVESLGRHLIESYQKQFQITPEVYITTATAGASVVQ
ncbi:MAG: galactokinase [Phycisphaerales bacterium]|nr:galactokinase [Phycisphaerales bacterium]